MSLFKKIGVAVAVSALASGTALSGAAISHAQPGGLTPVFAGPSSVSVSGRGGDSAVTYTNRSGHDLVCGTYLGPGRLIGDLYDFIRTAPVNTGLPPELSARLEVALGQGRVGVLSFLVEDGQTTVTETEPDDPDSGSILSDSSFAPHALAMCTSIGEIEEIDYAEVEVSQGAGVPSGLGSLDAALTGLGSSGSVAGTTGSLGS